MPIPQRHLFPSSQNGLSWLVTDDGSLTLRHDALNETYHSGCGAVAESLVVYLANSGVLNRLASGMKTRVFELGFGTGTAFLLTAACAETFQCELEFFAIENNPLPASILTQLNIASHLSKALNDNELLYPNEISTSKPHEDEQPLSDTKQLAKSARPLQPDHFTHLPELTQQLVGQWPASFEQEERSGAMQRLQFCLGRFTRLNLIVGNAQNMLPHRDLDSLSSKFDAVYYDAFSPESCPQLWTVEMFQLMKQILSTQGRLTSYCVKSQVRHQLAMAGFEVERHAGPVGGKRQVLVACPKFN